MRKLVSIQKIDDIQPIEDADKIVCASVLGWKVVIKKDSFKVGDKCVYFEVDSYLPIEDRYEFLRGSSFRKHEVLGDGFRIKTQKLRGQISQGLVLPLKDCELDESLEVGTDVTEKLGVRKWISIETISDFGTMIQGMPFSISPTDETRVQTIPKIIDEFKGLEYYITTKVDGTSITVAMQNGKFKVCSHENEIKNDGKSFVWRMMDDLKIKEKLIANHLDNIAIQGEFAGPKIQKNRLQLAKPQWFVFTMIDLNTLERIDLYGMKDICKLLNLTMVDIEEIGFDLPSKYPTIGDLLERAKGFYKSGRRKEGIVIRPIIPCYSKILKKDLSFKVLNNDFLLKDDK